MPQTHDVMRCRTKPLRRADYPGVTFSAAQWAALQKLFADGVCDFSKPGEDRVGVTPWQSYQDDSGRVVYGGRGLGRAPESEPFDALPSSRSCVSRRNFRLRLRGLRPGQVRSATVYVDGRRRATRRGRTLSVPVNLRGLRRKTVEVRVVVRSRTGKRVVLRRSYRTCTKKAAKRKAAPRRTRRG
jgi:hypothetical protein